MTPFLPGDSAPSAALRFLTLAERSQCGKPIMDLVTDRDDRVYSRSSLPPIKKSLAYNLSLSEWQLARHSSRGMSVWTSGRTAVTGPRGIDSPLKQSTVRGGCIH